MKTLLLTTALTAVTAFGATAHANAFNPEARADARGDIRADAPAFLSSTFTGMTVYSLDPADATAMPDRSAAADAGYDRARSVGYLADRDNWDDIGSINDIVMTSDGEIRGILVDVGGFLGLGAHTVLVDADELSFVADDSDTAEIDDFFVVISMSREELEALPEWDDDQLRNSSAGHSEDGYSSRTNTGGEAGASARNDSARTDAAASARANTPAARTEASASARQETPAAERNRVFPDGYEALDRDARTADRLTGADVYDAAGNKVGSVNDLVLDGDDISGLLVDVGGFLGLGAHTVNLPIDRADIRWNEDDDDVRVQVPMARAELEALPEHDD